MTKKGRKRNKSSPLVQNPNKKQNIRKYFTQDMAHSKGSTLSMETLASCAETERDIEALKDKSLEEIIRDMAKDIKDIKLQQHLDNRELSDLRDEVRELKTTNDILTNRITVLETEVTNLKAYSMRNNLLFRNVPSSGPDEDIMRKVREILCNMGIPNSNNISIERAHRLGKPGTSSPIVVKFSFYQERLLVWRQRSNLKGSGFFLAEHFPTNIENDRREFYPLISTLKTQFGKENVYLKKDILVCNKQEYNVQKLPKLLERVKGDPGSRNNSNVHVFLGKYSPLSNFFPCDIKVNDTDFCSSEQAYQHAKCIYAGKPDIAKDILNEQNPVRIKHAGDSVDNKQWYESGQAEKAMKNILAAKFSQVSVAKKTLIETGTKTLGEANASKNAMFWATGISKGSKDALNTSKWSGQNRLGKMLEDLRLQICNNG